MRLVDVDAFIEWFKKNYELEETDEDTGEVTEYDKWISSVDIIDDIEQFETAYDVDKVVEQLKKELKQANEDKERYIHGNPLEFDMANRAIGYAVGINYAIEIVRKGGVSDE